MVGEGIETCVAAIQATAYPAWAALSTLGLRSLDLPKDVRNVIILADGDHAGEAPARDCALNVSARVGAFASGAARRWVSTSTTCCWAARPGYLEAQHGRHPRCRPPNRRRRRLNCRWPAFGWLPTIPKRHSGFACFCRWRAAALMRWNTSVRTETSHWSVMLVPGHHRLSQRPAYVSFAGKPGRQRGDQPLCRCQSAGRLDYCQHQCQQRVSQALLNNRTVAARDDWVRLT